MLVGTRPFALLLKAIAPSSEHVITTRLLVKTICFAMLLVSAAEAAPDAGQFGLDCTGTSVDGVKHITQPIHYRMSVDTISKTWCILPECDGRRQLGPVTDAEIRLFDEPLSTNYLVATVDRRTRAYDLVMQSELANIHVTGTCTWTPFTPFPPDIKRVYPPFPRAGTHVVDKPPLPLP